MLKRVGLLIMGVSFLATGSCLAGGDPDIKAEEVAASTPNGAATATSSTNSGTAASGSNSSGASASAANTGSVNAGQRDDSFDAIENDELLIDVIRWLMAMDSALFRYNGKYQKMVATG